MHDEQLHAAARRFDERVLKTVTLGVLAFALYFISRTRLFGGDDTVFALVVQRWLEEGAVEPALVHPHHVLYNPLVAVWALIVFTLRGSVFVLDAGAAVSAAAAAAMVALLHLVLRRNGIADGTAMLVSATAMLAGGVWQYATRMEVYTLAALGVAVWLAAVTDENASWRRLAVGLGAGWLGHSVLGLLTVPAVWLHWRRPRQVAAAIVAGIVIPGVVVVTVMAMICGATSPADLVGMFASPELTHWLSPPSPLGMCHALQGLAVWKLYNTLPVYPPWARHTFDVLGVLIVTGLSFLMVIGIVEACRRRSRLAVVAGAGVLALVPLWLLWDIGNTEHVVAATPLFAALIAIGATKIGARAATPVLVCTTVVMLLVNGIGSALLGTQANLSRTLQVAYHIRDHLPEDATLLSIGVDPEYRLALPHLCGRRVVSLTLLTGAAKRAGATPDDALRRWFEAGVEAPHAWVFEDLDSPQVTDWVASLGVSPPAWYWVRQHLTTTGIATLPADGLVIKEPVSLRQIRVLAPEPQRESTHQREKPSG